MTLSFNDVIRKRDKTILSLQNNNAVKQYTTPYSNAMQKHAVTQVNASTKFPSTAQH